AREALSDASRAAAAYRRSSLLRLRHQAVVGHGLGAPSRDEVADTWQHSRRSIARHGRAAEAVLTDDGYPLPGLPSLLAAIAGTPMTPDTLLGQTQEEIVNLLDPEGLVW